MPHAVPHVPERDPQEGNSALNRPDLLSRPGRDPHRHAVGSGGGPPIAGRPEDGPLPARSAVHEHRVADDSDEEMIGRFERAGEYGTGQSSAVTGSPTASVDDNETVSIPGQSTANASSDVSNANSVNSESSIQPDDQLTEEDIQAALLQEASTNGSGHEEPQPPA